MKLAIINASFPALLYKPFRKNVSNFIVEVLKTFIGCFTILKIKLYVEIYLKRLVRLSRLLEM